MNNETKRLHEVRELMAIADAIPGSVLDKLVKQAGIDFDMPIVLVSLVDQDKQFFKAAYGTELKETAREVAFCTYTIMEDQVMVVPDATKDFRFKSNPLVTEQPNIRFYAGAPMITPEGNRVGTICMIDSKPREFTAEQSQRLQNLAQSALDHIIAQVRLKNVA